MKIRTENRTYFVKKAPSIFTSRNNSSTKLEDVSVFESGYDHGVRFEGESGRFVTIAKFAAEDGHTIRNYKQLPKEISADLLKQWGFIA